MKKSLILALSLAVAPVFAGEAPLAPAIVTTPAPVAASHPIALEVAGFYGFANNDIYRHGEGSVKDIDIAGADITGVYTVDKNHSVNLRFGYAFGDEQEPSARLMGMKWETDVHSFFLMPGYRYTHAINEKWSAYAGVNVGIASVSVKDMIRDEGGSRHAHDSDYGFAYSGELGLRYKLTENCELFGAYQFLGSAANPRVKYDMGDGESETLPVRQQSYNCFRAGVSVKF